MTDRNIDPAFLEKRLDEICDGVKEGVRREVKRLREKGLPVYVARGDEVVALPPDSPTQSDTP